MKIERIVYILRQTGEFAEVDFDNGWKLSVHHSNFNYSGKRLSGAMAAHDLNADIENAVFLPSGKPVFHSPALSTVFGDYRAVRHADRYLETHGWQYRHG